MSSPLQKCHSVDFSPTIHNGPHRKKLLTAHQEWELAARVASGDPDARDQLVSSNFGLVATIARAYTGRGLDLDDLIGEGNLGLIRAAQGFKSEFGTRFSTYAGYWIKQAIREALTNTAATIRLPAHMVALISKWNKAERALRRELGEQPTFEQVAITLALTEAQREQVRKARRSRNLAQERAGDDSPVVRSIAAEGRPGSEIERAESAASLRDRMAEHLDDRERAIIEMRFGLSGNEGPLTLKETGRRLGVTREWARKLELRAILKLRADGEAC